MAKSKVTSDPPVTPSRTITVMEDTLLEFPSLYLDVFIQADNSEYRQFAELFTRANCTRAVSPEVADLIVFGGGVDVNPVLYGELEHPSTYWDSARDKMDMDLYDYAFRSGIPMLGVCRGAQFGHVMHGGKLYQDVNGHYSDHSMWDLRGRNKVERVSSVHHQACIRPENNPDFTLLGAARESSKRYLNDTEFETGPKTDVEAFFYRSTHFLGVQGHPEYRGYYGFAKWTLDMIEELIVNSPDIKHLSGKGLRIKSELIEERTILAQNRQKDRDLMLDNITLAEGAL